MTSNMMRKTTALLGMLAVAHAASFGDRSVASAADDVPRVEQDAEGPIGFGSDKLACLVCLGGILLAGGGSVFGLVTLAIFVPEAIIFCGIACYRAYG